MKICFLVFVSMTVFAPFTVSAATVELTETELADGWISLLDGETLFGWKPVAECDWKVGKRVHRR